MFRLGREIPCRVWGGSLSSILYATDVPFSNDATGPILAPGFDLVIESQLARQERFAHGASDWTQPRLTAREISMLELMNAITDLPGWDDDIFDEAIVSVWRGDALGQWDLISPDAWAWCLMELRDSVGAFKKTSLVDVLNAASSICKSDAVIPGHVMTHLQACVETLAQESETGPGLSHLVDPSLYPLAYGRTVILPRGRQVPLDDIFSTVGKGVSYPPPNQPRTRRYVRLLPSPFDAPADARAGHWSSDFQMLPCEVRLPADGGTEGTGRVAITSYINNLHPERYSSLYGLLESVFAGVMPMWNRVVLKPDQPRFPRRIRTYGGLIEPQHSPSWIHELPPLWAEDHDPSSEAYQRQRARVEAYLALPDTPLAEGLPTRSGEYPYFFDGIDWEEQLGLREAAENKFNRIRRVVHPEPGRAFSFQEWKQGKTGRSVVPGLASWCQHAALFPETVAGDPGERSKMHQQAAKIAADDKRTVLQYPDHVPYDLAFDLRESWREQGLQVVVQLTRTALSPLHPCAEEQGWHIHGTISDRIVAAAVLVIDSCNTTTQGIDFRVQADLCPAECGTMKPTQRRALEITFGLPEEPMDGRYGAPAYQELGTIKLPVGRVVAYPNVLQHRMQPLHLLDPSAPGHQDRLTLLLVDPHYRLCSTANVPPQRHDWWFDAALKGLDWPKKLPLEMIYEIESYVEDFPVGKDRARAWQAKMNHDAQVCQDAVDFCVNKYQFRG